MTQHYADSDSNGNIVGYYNDDVWDVTKIPATAIQITEEEWQDSVNNPGKYVVDKASETLVLAPPPTAAQQLASAQSAKLAEIQAAATKALGTFASSALGSAHTYLSGTNDMLLIEAEDRFMQGSDWDGQNVLWYTVEAGDVDHTKAQIHQVYLDGRAAVQRKKYTAKNLVAQVKAATDAATVDAIDVTGADWS